MEIVWQLYRQACHGCQHNRTSEGDMKYSRLTYTQIPNQFLDDDMRKMSQAELKVTLAIMRNTFGWGRTEWRMSISYLMESTGLSNRAVVKGLQEGMDRGTIYRVTVGKTENSGYKYGIMVESDEKSQQPKVTKSHSESDEKSQLAVTKSHTTKKVLKKGKTTKETNDGGGDSVSFADVVSAYENNIGMFTQMTSESVQADFDEYGGQWLIDAMKIAVDANVRKWNYVAGILKKWAVTGKQDTRKETITASPIVVEENLY